MSAQNQPQTTNQTNERDAAIQIIPRTHTPKEVLGWWLASSEKFDDPDDPAEPVALEYSVFAGVSDYPHRIQVRVVTTGHAMTDVCFPTITAAAKFAAERREYLLGIGFLRAPAD